MPELEVVVCEGESIGKRACNSINELVCRFFSLGITQIEIQCNLRRSNLLADWRKQNPDTYMSEYSLNDTTYRQGICEAEPLFELSEPLKISVYIWCTRVSTGNQGDAPAEIECIDNQDNIFKLHVYLKMFELHNNILYCKGSNTSLEDILIHELLHACGDSPWNNRIDGLIRHNIIGIKAVQPLLT